MLEERNEEKKRKISKTKMQRVKMEALKFEILIDLGKFQEDNINSMHLVIDILSSFNIFFGIIAIFYIL